MSIEENSRPRYLLDIIANSYNSDTLSGVTRTSRKPEGPLTFARVVGRWIRNARKAKGWNQKELSEASGIAQGDLSDFENGKVKISSDHIEALLAAFEVEPRHLFSLLVGTVPELERELDADGKELPAPATHVKGPSGYKKKRAAKAAVSADPPTSHRQE
jgi:transcriptional regulator with XRE-family HTH domain